MKYRLKDRELQRKLDEISDGDFSKQLALNHKRIISSLEFLQQITLWFGKKEGPLHALEITPDMLEKASEYNPHAWNKYPDVTPPEGVWMRVLDANHHGFCAIFRSIDGWLDDLGFCCGGEDRAEIEFFRPWDDEEDKE